MRRCGRAWLGALLGWCGALGALAGAAPARAAPPLAELSELEREVRDEVLAERGFALDPAPEGKAVERVEIVRMPVFDHRDPVPDLFNVFHVVTLERVVRQELLVRPGEAWSGERVAESARALRLMPQLSLVLLVPVKGSRPDRVRLVVITKDVWSLRLQSDYQIADGKLASLTLVPAETNFLGTRASVGVGFRLRPDTWSLGLAYLQPRVLGSHITAAAAAYAIFNRETDAYEGSTGALQYGQPLWSSEAEWGWSSYYVWRREIFRRHRGMRVRTFDADVTPTDDAIPWVYHSDRQYAQVEVTRSLGGRFKHDVSLGWEAARQAFRADGVDVRSPAGREFVGEAMPVRDTRLSPYLQLQAHTTDYVSLLEFNTLALQEDYKVGHDVLARVYPASADLGSTRTLVGLATQGSWTAAPADGLVRVLVGHTREFAEGGRGDGVLRAGLRLGTPRVGPGRIVYDGAWLHHYDNVLNETLALGGEGRLRGYPLAAFLGQSLLAHSLELRTRSVSILSGQVGAALFHDVGAAYDRLSSLQLRRSVGVGVRLVLPQADRIVIRGDWGFPIADPEYRTFPGALFITFGQAFPMPVVAAPSVAAASAVATGGL